MTDSRKPLRITYDKKSDAAYIYFSDDIGIAGVAETVPVDPRAVGGMINLDFDEQGRLLGVEVLAASKRLPRQLLEGMDDA